jgi:hypothetical protein
MNYPYRGYELDPSEYGVDIFRNGGYVETLQDELEQPHDVWLQRAARWVNFQLHGSGDRPPCDHPDGSYELLDGNGIYLARVCSRCHVQTLLKYREDILRGYSQADVDEPIEPEEDW